MGNCASGPTDPNVEIIKDFLVNWDPKLVADGFKMVVPGGPPMSIDEFLGASKITKQAFPAWVSKVYKVVKSAEGEYTVHAQQCLGKMKAAMPPFGPFPEVPLDKVPEWFKDEECNLPVETGTVKINPQGKITWCGGFGGTVTYNNVKTSKKMSEIWGAKGDDTDVGFGALYTAWGVAPMAAAPMAA